MFPLFVYSHMHMLDLEGVLHVPFKLTPMLQALKESVERYTGEKFDSVS